jgi:hypothetical protein
MLYVMLVGAYPFERPEDKTDSQKLQKMIQVRAHLVTAAAACAAAVACWLRRACPTSKSQSLSWHNTGICRCHIIQPQSSRKCLRATQQSCWCLRLCGHVPAVHPEGSFAQFCVSVCSVFLCLQRILKVDYHIPSHIKLSPEGHDLLKKVLVADPAQRVNIQQVGSSL